MRVKAALSGVGSPRRAVCAAEPFHCLLHVVCVYIHHMRVAVPLQLFTLDETIVLGPFSLSIFFILCTWLMWNINLEDQEIFLYHLVYNLVRAGPEYSTFQLFVR